MPATRTPPIDGDTAAAIAHAATLPPRARRALAAKLVTIRRAELDLFCRLHYECYGWWPDRPHLEEEDELLLDAVAMSVA